MPADGARCCTMQDLECCDQADQPNGVDESKVSDDTGRKAVTAADTAPAPCKARPITKPCKLSAMPANKLPRANTAKPIKMIFFMA